MMWLKVSKVEKSSGKTGFRVLHSNDHFDIQIRWYKNKTKKEHKSLWEKENE